MEMLTYKNPIYIKYIEVFLPILGLGEGEIKCTVV